MKFHLVKTVYIEAAHTNRRGGAAQQRLHGHSYQVDLLASGSPDPAVGWIADFAELKTHFRDLYAQLDHHNLDAVPGLENDSTVPALARWIDERLKPRAPWIDGVRVRIMGDLEYRPVRLDASPFEDLPARIRFTFEAAQSLPQLPCDHHCRNIHGHSYRIEIGGGDLDAIARGGLEIYNALDHRFLNDVPGLAQSTVEIIGHWIWTRLLEYGAPPTAVVVQETPTSRCIYRGE